MPDESDTPALLNVPAMKPPTESESSTPPADEPSGKKPAVAENSVRKRIRKSVAQVFDVAGVLYRAGRGRPKKCRHCKGEKCEQCNWTGMEPKISDKPLADAPVAEKPPVAETASPELPPEPRVENPAPAMPDFELRLNALFRRCVAGGAKGFTEGCNAVTRFMAGRAGIDKDFTDKTLERAKPEPDALQDFSESVDLVLEKHAPAVKEGGEWYCLAMSAGRIAVPYATIWWEFHKEIERRKKLENQK